MAGDASASAAALRMSTTRVDRFATKQNLREFADLQYRRLMKMCGYAPIAVDTCKPPAVMRAAGKQYRYHAQWRVVRDGAKCLRPHGSLRRRLARVAPTIAR